MARIETWFKQDLKRPVKVQTLMGNVFTLDNVGSLIGVEVFSDGVEETLTGAATGYCILPDGTTISVPGTRSGNKAYILLPQSVLAYPGLLKITVKLTDGNEITTLLAVIATVARSRTDAIITPSQQIITDWSQQIAAEMQAVEDASAAQDAKISDLKSALANTNDAVLNPVLGLLTFEQGRFDRTTGNTVGAASVIRTADFIPESIARISCSSSYKFIVWAWQKSDNSHVGHLTADGTYGTSSTYLYETDHVFDWNVGYEYKITFYNATGTEIAPTEGTNCIAWVSTDSTLSIAGKAADANAVGRSFSNIENALSLGFVMPMMESHGFIKSSDGALNPSTNQTYGYSIICDVKPGEMYEYSFRGSASTLGLAAYQSKTDIVADLANSIVGNSSTISGVYIVPSGINALRICSIEFESRAILRPYIPNYITKRLTNEDIDDVKSNGIYTTTSSFSGTHLPDNVKSSAGVLFVVKDPPTAVVYHIFIQYKYGEIYTRYHTSSNGWSAWHGMQHSQIRTDVTNANDVTQDGVYLTSSVNSGMVNRPPADASGTWIVQNDIDRDLTYQTFIEQLTGQVYTRLRSNSAGWSDWNTAQRSTISILFVGNSLTQDGIAYLPYLLKNYYPEINFKFYMWYHGGHTLTEHYDDFVNNRVASIFSVAENTSEWTNYNNTKTMAWVLENFKFDVVCLEGYYNYTPTTTTVKPTDDVAAFNNVRDYIQNNYTGGNGLEFITLFHAPLRSDASNVFERTKQWNATYLQKTIAQDMIPIGIAVYRALSTDLDSLGDQGHLSPDGTHTQEGLPCLLQTYTALCWLLDKLAINKSVYGLPFKMTTAIYNTINVPGPNLGTGVIEGTNAQNLLAQEIAIQAYKEGKAFMNNNIYIEVTN